MSRTEGAGWVVALVGVALAILGAGRLLVVDIGAGVLLVVGLALVLVDLKHRERKAREASDRMQALLKLATRTPVIRSGMPGWLYKTARGQWEFSPLEVGELESWRHDRVNDYKAKANAADPEGPTARATPTKETTTRG